MNDIKRPYNNALYIPTENLLCTMQMKDNIEGRMYSGRTMSGVTEPEKDTCMGKLSEILNNLFENTEVLGGEEGRKIHNHIVKIGSLQDIFVANYLVAMYTKCGQITSTRNVFDNMPL